MARSIALVQFTSAKVAMDVAGEYQTLHTLGATWPHPGSMATGQPQTQEAGWPSYDSTSPTSPPPCAESLSKWGTERLCKENTEGGTCLCGHPMLHIILDGSPEMVVKKW
ncbi:hypothetical protein AV530_014354 [Patagioenas fasciata monilis]|uniref:Uncharacterized protein n=1 Tax=Patagioenas fasciata monilis TaxID=372326 RepID=A0A1V4KBM3_PATFA|nr:hypothetical protein AV530_014354 [Patagioenas fasciata monilis]